MTRRLVIAALIAVFPCAAIAQAQVPRIGLLDPSYSNQAQERMKVLRGGFKKLGLEEGRHYILEYRSAEGRFEQLGALAEELVRLKVSVIIARNTPGVTAARAATQSIPIVMADVGDPLALGFIKSLSKPGGNITGLSNATIELIHKRLEILREALPGLRKVALLGNSEDQNTALQIAEARRTARKLGIDVRVFDARSDDQIGDALKEIAAWNPQAVLPLVNPLYRTSFSPRLLQWAPQRRMPVMYAFREEVEAGGLMAYSADIGDHYQRVAQFVAKLLRGADPATMAVERPTRFELSIHRRAAAAIDVPIPQSLLFRADRVIE
jgi:putative tryptophan/tyrosine transport system substrate-binding protein